MLHFKVKRIKLQGKHLPSYLKPITVNRIILLVLLFSSAQAFSQLNLTYRNNSLTPGDSINTTEVVYISPGNSGPNQLWDFSSLQFTGRDMVNHLTFSPERDMQGIEYNVLFNDEGKDYYFVVDENGSRETGFTSKDILLVYSDPIVKMKYPFSYNESFSDSYAGVALYQNNRSIETSGIYGVVADAFGTLLLPDKIVTNTLRLKIEKNGVEINSCRLIEIKNTRYLWYAPGARYPVFGISINEYSSAGQQPTLTQSAFVNEKMLKACTSAVSLDDVSAEKNINFDLTIYPNPFIQKLGYSYSLPEQMPVTIELYDPEGKFIKTLLSKQILSTGMHTGEFETSKDGLAMGVYFIRFTFSARVISRKVVKI